jgi:molybdopterin-guanine dinucleotide biosynthesis protein A
MENRINPKSLGFLWLRTISMTGIILAGGEGRRMGGINKAFLRIGGERIVDRIKAIFLQLFDEVILVTNNPLEYIDLGIRIVADLIPGMGSLGGVYTGLFYAKHPQSFVVACDMPFLKREVILYMMELAAGYDVVVPVGSAGIEPLHAIYSSRCMKPMEKQIENEDLRLLSLYPKMKVRKVLEEEFSRLDPDLLSFRNINTLDEYKKVKEYPPAKPSK